MKSLRELADRPQAAASGRLRDQEQESDRAAKQAEFAKANPGLALWTTIKEELTAANGEQYFETQVKGAALPGGANNVTKFKAKLVSQKPALRPKTLVVALSGDAPEVAFESRGIRAAGQSGAGNGTRL